jgi:hypothetical protein
MSEFTKYRRTQVAEMRPVTEQDVLMYQKRGDIIHLINTDNPLTVSISDVDKTNGSPKIGDMVARNPKNHLDQWLVAEQYFKDNFEPL